MRLQIPKDKNEVYELNNEDCNNILFNGILNETWITNKVRESHKTSTLKKVERYEREYPHSNKGYYLIDGIRHINGLRLNR